MRIAVKVGTSTLTHPTGRINIRHVEELCKVLSDIKNAGHEVLLVSSGATEIGRLDNLKRTGKQLEGDPEQNKTDYSAQG